MADPNFAMLCYYYQTCPAAFTPPPYAFHPFQPPNYSPPIPPYVYHQPQPPPYTPYTPPAPYTCTTPTPYNFNPFVATRQFQPDGYAPQVFAESLETLKLNFDASNDNRQQSEVSSDLVSEFPQTPSHVSTIVSTAPLMFDESPERVRKVVLLPIDKGEENTVGYEPWNRDWDWDDESDVEIETEVEGDSESVLGGKVSFRDSGDVCDEGEENWDTSEGCELWDRSWDWDSEMEKGGEIKEKGEVDDVEDITGLDSENCEKVTEGDGVSTLSVQKDTDMHDDAVNGASEEIKEHELALSKVVDNVVSSIGDSMDLKAKKEKHHEYADEYRENFSSDARNEVGRDFNIGDVETEMKSGSEEFKKEKWEMKIVANEHYVWDTPVDFPTVKGVDEKENEIITPTLMSCATATLNIKALTVDDVHQSAIGTLVEITQFNPSHDWGDAEPAIEKAQEAWFNDEDSVKTCVGLLKKPVAECRKLEDSLKDDGRLFIDIHLFLAFGKYSVGWNFEKTENPVYLHIKQKKKPDPEDRPLKKPTLLAIGVDGGFDNHEVEYEEEYCIVILPDYATLPYPSVKLHEKVRLAVDAVVSAEGAERKEQVASWTADKKQISEHALTLQQIENGVIISPSGGKCAKCDKTENLWLKLTDGMILCGRRNWDGSGGKNHAIEHYKETGYSLAVKLGTKTSDLERADVFCYPEDESVLDPHLAQHLAFFGIDFSSLQKTEMTTADRELDQNTNFDWNRIQESGQEVEPLWIFDPGDSATSFCVSLD